MCQTLNQLKKAKLYKNNRMFISFFDFKTLDTLISSIHKTQNYSNKFDS